MVFGKKATFCCVAVVFATFCLDNATVLAKKTKDPTSRPTNTPTVSPSSSPTMTTSPSLSPSRSPSFFPTSFPTSTPSAKPSPSPTRSPTYTPTRSPTDNPTDLPTPFATKPTGVSISDPIDDTYALLPIITFDLIVLEDISTEQLQLFFTDYLDEVIKEISDTYRFDFSHLDSNGIISTFDQTQSPGIKYRVRMDGHLYYDDEAPTQESLVQSLNVYFSFWGSSDLQERLTNIGFDEADVVSISIGGEAVSFVSNAIEVESQEVEIENNASQNDFLDDGGGLSKSTVVMLYAGFVIAAAVISLLIFRHYIGRKRRKRDVQSQSYERRSSKKSNNGGNGKRNSLNAPKILPHKMRSVGKSNTSCDTDTSDEQVLSESEKVSKDIENAEGLSQPLASQILPKFLDQSVPRQIHDSKTHTEKKSNDSILGQETNTSKDDVSEKL